jgi:hypothetical protein
MSLTQGDPLPNIETTKTVDTKGPDWYNDYLKSLASAGTSAMKKTGDQLVSPMSTLQTDVLNEAKKPGALSGYTTELEKAQQTADLAAKGITPELIQQYMNPYTRSVNDEMARLQQQNLQQTLLPSLKGAFTATGGAGSSRMMGALGQMGAEQQANLLGAQTKSLQSGYDSALQAALNQAKLYGTAAETQKGLATTEQEQLLKDLSSRYELGGKEQAFNQSKILAPLAAAKSAADVFANVKVPSTVSETANAPIPGAYANSPLATISGLATLFASGSGGTSAAKGFTDWLTSINPNWKDWFKDAPDTTGGSHITGPAPVPGDPDYVAPIMPPDDVVTPTPVEDIPEMPPI